MFRFIESICLRDGKFQNLELHEKRMHRALQSIHSNLKIGLSKILSTQKIPESGWWKCRLIYDQTQEISFEKYRPKPVSSLKIVHDNSIDYSHKYMDRSRLEKLFAMKESCDDIIIIKNGNVTDSLYANLVFKKGNDWFTPESFLLPGIMRERLLKDQIIQTAVITETNIRTFEKVKLINALLGFDGPEIEIENIFE